MTLVERVDRFEDARSIHPTFQLDTITLTWEERRQGHGKRRSGSGLEFAVSLPAGTVLKQDDCFVLAAEATLVAVREAVEAVYVIQPKTPQQWAYYAYQIGNRHQSLMIGDSELIFPRNAAVRSLLDQLHADYRADERPFTAALANIGHSHE